MGTDHPGEAARLRRPLTAVLVTGPSMAPTLRHGDAVLVRPGGRPIRPGDVVVAVFRTRPELLVVKRAVRPQDGGWWLHGDNDLITDDSRAYGVADVRGRVVARYWPRPGRVPRRRI
ncbi:S24/S26 family peptidase [Micromonospora zamorensis]|uniref:S24/S26 family peptidase n=1 Tax=Micromonospora zamorensis TaxID=709883 RepID=A0ABZ1PHD3_9ACTN|nr:S24/S26 family peptidase [Micromonospora zamorensis]TQJ24891.1 peptidase S24-like protein [Micromonospora sp. A202]WTE86509.1 S24/S26 family peptidase [Micromonospora zamorensis]SCG63147.1 Peptidase S24-like [Micromonospora zamorensis]